MVVDVFGSEKNRAIDHCYYFLTMKKNSVYMIIKKIFKKVLEPISGKIVFQKIFNLLFNVSIIGKNIGRGDDPSISGELFLLQKILPDCGTKKYVIFDVGANIGKYAQLLLSQKRSMDLYCFEPSLSTFNELNKNLVHFTQGNLFLINIGFGEQKGSFTLYSVQEKPGLSSIYRRNLEHFKIRMENEEKIYLDTIDNFCQEKKVNWIDFLKLDIEGNEFFALKGAKKMLSEKKIGFIQFEFGGCNIDSRTFFQDFFYLLHPDFKIYRILKDGLWEIKKYSESDELFMTTNYLAINRDL